MSWVSAAMKFLNRATQRLNQKLDALKRKGIDLTSLQFRLTLALTTVSLLGLGSIGSWTIWQMRQMLIVDHQNYLKSLSDRIPAELAAHHDQGTIDTHLQALINQWSSPNLWLWVKENNGTVLAASTNISSFPGKAALMPKAMMPNEPQVSSINGRYLVLCSQPLDIQGNAIGDVYLAQDITHDYEVQNTLVNNLIFATILAIALIAILITYLIWRSLHPLRQINRQINWQVNQLAIVQGESFTHSLELDEVDLAKIPSEMKGLVQAFGLLSTKLSTADAQQRQFTNQFTNSISHEIRTSLSLVYGYLQSTLRRCTNLTDSQKEALEVAVDETERTIQLLKDLVDLARINSDTMEFSLEPVVLNDVVTTAVHMANLPDATIEIMAAAEMVIAQADRDQLIRVIRHLLDNAVRYAKDQLIVLKLSETSSHALLQVCDRGCGIPIKDQAHIFEPFYRVENSRCRATGGVGLGLAIVKSLVEGMHGQITVKSLPDEGSIFTVMLPLGGQSSP
jgi:signal transduction histidine kinase